MATAKQYWSAADGLAYLALSNGISPWWELNTSQHAMVQEAAALWEDVCNVDWIEAVDDDALAAQATTFITETFLGIPYNSYWEVSLTADWTRLAVGDIVDFDLAGINARRGADGRYHEIYIDTANDGLFTFAPGSRAFYTVVHEMGHSMGFGHVSADRTQTVMAASEDNDSTTWFASTPMTLDIDAAIAAFGAKTTTRTGSDVYGFNASFSDGGYRDVYDFNVNKRPLVTIYDNGGYDWLDASKFVDDNGVPRDVTIDLQPGHTSFVDFTPFAVIYRTTTIEAARGGGGNDVIIGNDVANLLVGNKGDDNLTGGGGNDVLRGGEGHNTIDGGAGIDWADYSDISAAIEVNLTNGFASANGGRVLDTLTSIENAIGTAFNDTFAGDSGNNEFHGGDGDDTMIAGLGNDKFQGDGGVDTVDYSQLGTRITVDLENHSATASIAIVKPLTAGVTADLKSESVSTVLATGDLSPRLKTDQLFTIENVVGTAFNDTLIGNTENNVLDGGAGADDMRGGQGDDTYVVDDVGDQVIENPTQSFGFSIAYYGTDTIRTSLASYSLASAPNVENLIGTGMLGQKLTGSGGDNMLAGGAGDDRLDGGDGTDTAIYSGARADYQFTRLADDSLRIIDMRDGSPDGNDVGSNIELFRFADHTYSLSELALAAKQVTTADFDSDARGDLLWQNADGRAAIWLMDGMTKTGGADLQNNGPTWHAKATGDFNGDGKADILWQNDDGRAAVWLMDGTTNTYGADLQNNGPTWHAMAAADFNGDGKADILWQNDNGAAAIWLMDGATIKAGANLQSDGPTWHVKAAVDFNGDGKADILWQNDDGRAAIWLMDGTVKTFGGDLQNNGPTWHINDAVDFDGDAKADILWQNDNGATAIWLMDGATIKAGANVANNGPTWHAERADDVSGDGKADILWHNDNGAEAVWLMDGTHQIGGANLESPGSGWHVI